MKKFVFYAFLMFMFFSCGTESAKQQNKFYKVHFSVVDSVGGSLRAHIKDSISINSSPFDVEEGSIVVFTAESNGKNYRVEHWEKNGIKIANFVDKTYQILVRADVDVKVKFRQLVLNEQSKTFEVNKKSFVMKLIDSANNIKLGNDEIEDNKVHSASLSSYYIGETEVSQSLWHAVMGENPSFYDNSGKKYNGNNSFETSPAEGEEQENRPVENISWYECIAFCNELTKLTEVGEAGCVYYSDEAWSKIYTKEDAKKRLSPFIYGVAKNEKNLKEDIKKGFRLPTATEWEWAALGGKEEKWAGCSDQVELEKYCWYNENSKRKTHESGKKLPNAYELYDMSGNVWEWVWDWAFEINAGEDLGLNPIGPFQHGNEKIKLTKGGSWGHPALECKNATVGAFQPEGRMGDLGLRLACSK